MSQQGFANETELKEALNNKKISELNNNLKTFILSIFNLTNNDANLLIRCEKNIDKNKGDIVIFVNSKKRIVSLKMGTGNSVHQEPVESFISFLKESFNLDNETADCLRLFIWGDETLNGTGLISKRLSANKFKKTYPQVVNQIQQYFNEHKRELLKRFIIEGVNSQTKIDFIYHGNIEKGYWLSSEKLIEWLESEENESNGAISVGALTFQAWNRNINGGNLSEHKRGVIQLKWATMGHNLIKILNE